MTSNNPAAGADSAGLPAFGDVTEYWIVWDHRGTRALVPAVSGSDARATLASLRDRHPADCLTACEVTVRRTVRELDWLTG